MSSPGSLAMLKFLGGEHSNGLWRCVRSGCPMPKNWCFHLFRIFFIVCSYCKAVYGLYVMHGCVTLSFYLLCTEISLGYGNPVRSHKNQMLAYTLIVVEILTAFSIECGSRPKCKLLCGGSQGVTYHFFLYHDYGTYKTPVHPP